MNNNFFKTQDILSEKKSVRTSIQHHPIQEEPEFLSAYVVPKGELQRLPIPVITSLGNK
jgi:hypothetical protein